MQASLRAGLKDFTNRSFGADPEIDWIVVPKGSGFTAAVPSTAVITSMPANRPLDQSERVALLTELNDLCVTTTQRSANEVVTSISDPQ